MADEVDGMIVTDQGSLQRTGYSFYSVSGSQAYTHGSVYYRQSPGLLAVVRGKLQSATDAWRRFRALSRANQLINERADTKEESVHVWHDELDIAEIDDQTFISQNPLFRAASTNDVDRLEAALKLRMGARSPPSAEDLVDFFGQRSPNGATALHIAVLYNSRDVMLKLIGYYPEIINMVQTGAVYEGQHALHLAVANRNFRLLKDLMRHHAKLSNSVRATGSFFRPDSKRATIYWGESVLSFAACSGQLDVVKYLVGQGADLTVQDAELNNVLHLLSQAMTGENDGKQKASMIVEILDIASPRDREILLMTRNRYGWTPLKMAAYQGAVEAFQALVEYKRSAHWNYGPIRSSVYSLDELDTAGDENSVLNLIVTSPSQNKVKLVQVTPVRQLLAEKWKDFVRLYFALFAILYVIHLTVLSCVVWYRPVKMSTCYSYPANNSLATAYQCRPYVQRATYDDAYSSAGDYARLVGELFLVAWVAFSLKLEVVDMWKNFVLGKSTPSSIGLYNMIAVAYDMCVVTVVLMRLADAPGEEIPMCLAVILGFLYLLHFARAIPSLGPYTVMIGKMMYGDVMRFLAILIVFVPSFTIARAVITQKEEESQDMYGHSNFFLSVLNLFFIAIGNANVDITHIGKSPYPVLDAIVNSVFLVVATVLLLNLLIAMMSNTYQLVKDHQFDVWNFQMASLVLFIESRMLGRCRIRSGFPGRSIGLKKDARWYLRVEDEMPLSTTGTQEAPPPLSAGPVPAHNPPRISTVAFSLIEARRAKLAKQPSILSRLSNPSEESTSLYTPSSPGLGVGYITPHHGGGVGGDSSASSRRPLFFSFTPDGASHLARSRRSRTLDPPETTSTSISNPSATTLFSAHSESASAVDALGSSSAHADLDDSDYEEPWASRDTMAEDLDDGVADVATSTPPSDDVAIVDEPTEHGV